MNFDFSEEQRLLQRTARDFLDDHAPLAIARSAFEAPAPGPHPLWKAVAEMGWLGTAVPETHGGAGYGPLELALIAQEVGRALAPIPFGTSVCLATEAVQRNGSTAQQARHLPDLVSGARAAAWTLAEGAGPATPESIRTELRGGQLHGHKPAVVDATAAQLAIVAARTPQGVVFALAELDHPSVTREPVRSLDAARPLCGLRFDGTPAEPLARASWDDAQAVLDRAATLLAFEQIGTAERAFDLTREYCMQRYAFGRPIASFQALKHRMADIYVALELARSNAYYAAWALAEDSPELATAA
jgi:acyl-CoA dehydrogenase